MNDILEQLLQEELELQFTGFNEAIAWQIGSQLVERSAREGLPVAIDITRGGRQLFHASLPGASADNDEWIKQKVRLVYRFGHSSFYMGQLLKSNGKKASKKHICCLKISTPRMAAVSIRDTGAIGTITISGLPQEDDHKLVVQAIRDYLRQEK
jgi:uncharacterized protein (UPF0303 family)